MFKNMRLLKDTDVTIKQDLPRENLSILKIQNENFRHRNLWSNKRAIFVKKIR